MVLGIKIALTNCIISIIYFIISYYYLNNLIYYLEGEGGFEYSRDNFFINPFILIFILMIFIITIYLLIFKKNIFDYYFKFILLIIKYSLIYIITIGILVYFFRFFINKDLIPLSDKIYPWVVVGIIFLITCLFAKNTIKIIENGNLLGE